MTQRFCLVAALLLCAASAAAQPFNVTIAPNNFTVAAGSTATITVTTQSDANTPPATAGITYSLALTPDFAGGTPQIPTNSPQVSLRTSSPPPNNWNPVMFTLTVPANAVPGLYSGPLVASYLNASGTAVSTDIANVFVTVSG